MNPRNHLLTIRRVFRQSRKKSLLDLTIRKVKSWFRQFRWRRSGITGIDFDFFTKSITIKATLNTAANLPEMQFSCLVCSSSHSKSNTSVINCHIPLNFWYTAASLISAQNRTPNSFILLPCWYHIVTSYAINSSAHKLSKRFKGELFYTTEFYVPAFSTSSSLTSKLPDNVSSIWVHFF